MGWLEDLEYEYNFQCQECGIGWSGKSKDKPEAPECPECGISMSYNGFTPVKMGGLTKISFEKNGIQAWRITDADGNVRHVSKQAEDYYNTAKNQGKYSKDFTEKVKENTDTEFRKFKKEFDSKATVTSAYKGAADEV